MDYNVVVLAGKLAAPPEVRKFESGSELIRFLITVRTETPKRRVDVVSATYWEPSEDHSLRDAVVGSRVWVTGQIQRRFWSTDNGRQSQLEVVAHDVTVYAPSEGESNGNG